VLDIGGGRGTTASHLAREYSCEVVGIDVSSDMVETARRRVKREGLENQIIIRHADAHDLPFESESFDVILIECVTTLLERDRAFREFRRVLKINGYLGDLEMTCQQEPSETFSQQLTVAWSGFTTMALSGWENLFRENRVEVILTDDFSERLGNIQKTMMRELGIGGVMKMAWKLLRQPQVARGFMK
jgi:arsenite methyltransferase